MKKAKINLIILGAICVVLFAVVINGQNGRERFSGTVISYGSGFDTRTRTGLFDLTIRAETPDAQAQQFLNTLQEGGQDDLLKAIRDEDRGGFSIGANLARTINVVREREIDGKRVIHIVFERWLQFAELRGGYRSLDYPFSYIELNIDPATGRGEGTYIAAAKIRWKQDKKTNGYKIEIEDFATFPARLVNVRSRTDRVRR